MSRRKLSQRQIERIGRLQDQRRERLAQRVEEQLADTPAAGEPREGRVLVRHGARLAVDLDQGGGTPHLCQIRQNIGHPVCGDRVVWQPLGPGAGVVTALLPRSTTLARPNLYGQDKALAANLSQLVVVVAPLPEPVEYLLDQYLVAAERIGLGALIALNKMDLLEPDGQVQFKQRFARYERIGYPMLTLSARWERGLIPLERALAQQASILVGQSGVGKSSLIKALLPDLEIQTNRLSEATGLGRHTTSTATWYALPQGGALVDSPGVRSFRLGPIGIRDLELGYRECRALAGGCQFGDCHHDQEPGCALKAAVSDGRVAPERLASFRHMAARLGRS